MDANAGDVRANQFSQGYLVRSLPRAFAYIAVYALTSGLASLLWQHPVTLTLTYALLSAVLLWRWHSFPDVLFFALPAILGPLGEFVAISSGAWEYSLPLLNIPLWLPLAWGISALCMKKIADVLMEARAAEAHNNSLERTGDAAAEARANLDSGSSRR